MPSKFSFQQSTSLRKYSNSLHNTQLTGLDGLKALAIIGVTLFHLMPEAVPGGYLGVCLFFLITGYLLAYTSVANHFNLWNYFLKRFKRIYPPLLIVVFATLGIYYFLLPDALSGMRPELASIFAGYNNWWQISQNADYFTRMANGSPFTHLWFLAIELQYFLIWPVVFGIYYFLHQRFNFTTGLVFMVIITVGTALIMPLMYSQSQDITRLYYGTDTRIYALFFGALLGLLKARNYPYYPSNLLALGSMIFFILLVIATIFGYGTLEGDNPYLYQGLMVLATAGFGIMVILATQQDLPLGLMLDYQPFKWLGQHSYSIFLWQYPLLYLAQKLDWEGQIGNIYLYNILMLALLLILTWWTDNLLKKWPSFFAYPCPLSKIGKTGLVATTVITIVFAAFGVFGTITASNQKAQDIKALQAQLAANAAMLEAEQAKAKAQAEATKLQVAKSMTKVACIGDSVMLASAGSLKKALPDAYIDAKVSRYVGGGLEVAKKMDAQGQLGKVVLVGLGTNGPISGARYEKGTKDLVEYLGPDRQIFWVNVYAPGLKWQNPNNEYLAKLAQEHPNITIIDWYSLISKHKEWLTGDGVHPNNQGIREYVKLVRSTMENHFAKQEARI